MKILYLRPYEGEEIILKELLPADTSVIFADDINELSADEKADISVISVFVDYPLSKAELDQFPELSLIATRSAGYDHIDLDAARARGVTVARVPHYGTRTVAEFATALMFALSRNAFRAYTDMLQRTAISELDYYEGFDLCGKTLGVVGTGAIGRNVCMIARGLGMRVIAYDIQPDQTFAKDTDVVYQALSDVLANSNIVTLHVPSLPETRHLIDKKALATMKAGSYLINTARGEIVDTRALVAALASGHLAGAGLDVLEGEKELREEVDLLRSGRVDPELWQTLVADHSLIDMPNVIVTPHIAFNTREAKQEITTTTVENIQAWQAGEPINII